MCDHIFLQLQHFFLSRFDSLLRKLKSFFQALVLAGQLLAAFHPFLGLLPVKFSLLLAVLHLNVSKLVSGDEWALSAKATKGLARLVHGSLAIASIDS